ncbi:hypothetical protein AGRA3207_000526 [Actinomadura graeca]|uniref:Glycosyltransferase n=1 Tax=Actinomadura graeca TaxID=2750812 RepID=A0ABX8QMF9_9ACTN|nr:hypothetical protein [Actinomadura graeca]QXJ19915.1 hypothetical protein AGRA3207_000526 [Actinomadura graeca]
MAASPLWAVTSYFNPSRYSRKRRNFEVFRDRLGVPLVAAECSVDGEFELSEGDADIVVRFRGDVMWQKERLLNLALREVPAETAAIAWLDCDVVLDAEDWAERAVRALDDHVLVQPFSRAYWLEPDDVRFDPAALETVPRRGFGRVAAGGDRAAIRAWRCPDTGFGLPEGYAWVGRGDVLREHGWYDAYVMGSGTMEFALAAVGELMMMPVIGPVTAAQAGHLLDWARPFADAVRGRVGHIEGNAFHLWHGTWGNRRYAARRRDFFAYGFDPYEDIAAAPSDYTRWTAGEGWRRHRTADGAWTWASDKPDMHRFVDGYFNARLEDTVAADPDHGYGDDQGGGVR